MRLRAAPLAFFVSVAFAIAVYVGAVRPTDLEIDRLRGEILAQSLAPLDPKLIAGAPGKGGEALIEAAKEVERRTWPTEDVWTRWGAAPSQVEFPRVFRDRVTDLERVGVLGTAAWVEYDWETLLATPTTAECRRAAQIFLLVKGMTEVLQPRGRVEEKIRRISLDRDSDDVGLTIDFDPERSSELLSALTGARIGGEPFELVSFEAVVGEHGSRPATATIHLRLPRR